MMVKAAMLFAAALLAQLPTHTLAQGSPATAERAVWPPGGSTWTMRATASGSLGSGTRETILESLGEVEWEGRRVMGYRFQGGPQLLFDLERRILAQVRNDKPLVTYHPYEALYEWPLVVGKSWRSEFQQKRYPSGEMRDFKFQFTVEAFEEVATPGGAFKAFRILRTSPNDRYVVWYEPVLGIEVKRDWERVASHPDGVGTHQLELLSYNINK